MRSTLQALRGRSAGFILADSTVGALDYAASAAADYWPACSQWELIAADEETGAR